MVVKTGPIRRDDSKVHRGAGVPPPRHEVDRNEAKSHVGVLPDSDARAVGGGSIEIYLGLVSVKAGVVLGLQHVRWFVVGWDDYDYSQKII